MSDQSTPDLAAMRTRLGLTVEGMAAGIGWRTDDALEVERGEGSDVRSQFYYDWLVRLARQAPAKIEANRINARAGRRFLP